LRRAHARGHITVGTLALRSVVAHDFAADAELDASKLTLRAVNARIFGGVHRGEWSADFTSAPPQYSGSGTLRRASLAQISSAMHDAWAIGTLDATYRVAFSGWGAGAILASADGSANFDWRDGTLTHVMLAPDRHEMPAALRFADFRGRLALSDGRFTISTARIRQAGGSIYQVSGTATFDRILSLKLTAAGSPPYRLEGTLAMPHVLYGRALDEAAPAAGTLSQVAAPEPKNPE
jgi:uncharacterized protein involved in outer membrane biogenesis